jgi:hypothetical protein
MLALIVPAAIFLFGVAFTVAMMVMSVKMRNRVRLIVAAPLCKCDQLVTGLAKMRGTIVALDEEDLLVSPMTRTRCVFYKFVIEEQRTRTVTERQGNRTVRRTEHYWHPIITDVQAVPTAVKDKTGEALVDLKEAELTLAAMQARSGSFKSVPADLERSLQKRYGVSSKGLIFNKSMRYTEAVIEPGARVFVVGDCKVRKNGSACFCKGDHPLLITDKNEDELVGHYKTRFYGYTGASVAVPTIFVGIAGFVGFTMAKHEAPHPQPAAQKQPQAPPAATEKSKDTKAKKAAPVTGDRSTPHEDR